MLHRFDYTQAHVDFIKQHYMLPANELTALFNKEFSTKRTAKNIHAKRKQLGLRTGRTGKFEKGITPWNHGMKGMEVHENTKATQFKKGCKPINFKPIGHERICSKDGYILIKVAERNPYTGAPTRYRHKQQVVWEQHNGPLEKDQFVRFFDGDKKNCDINNLFVVSKAVNLRLNKHRFNQLPEELKPVVKTLSALEVDMYAKIRKQEEAANA